MVKDILNPSIGHNHNRRQKQANFVVNLGLAFNALLAAGKLGGGIVGHSQALLADGVNSFSDVAYFLIIKIFVKLSGKPADVEHPYGHFQYETIAALVVGAFVITTAAAIFWDSVNAAVDLFMRQAEMKAVRALALYIILGTIALKIGLMLQARAVGLATKNPAITAIARDHRNDLFASVGATAGILFSILGYAWADPLMGAVVALIVAKTGFDILRESAGELMDNVPGEELSRQIESALSDLSVVKRVEEIHAHRFGPYLVVNITICIEGSLNVYEADRVAESAERKLLESIDMLRKVYVHIHPADA
jgi:cation diffusion facilitator family transporter